MSLYPVQVYSIHTYGPSQHVRPEFSNPHFPANMQDVWEVRRHVNPRPRRVPPISPPAQRHTEARTNSLSCQAHWGELVKTRNEGTPAVVVGEWGGPVSDANGQWAAALVRYLTVRRASPGAQPIKLVERPLCPH